MITNGAFLTAHRLFATELLHEMQYGMMQGYRI